MSIRALNWAWEQRTGDPTAKALLAALADMADEADSCWPSMEFLADRVEVSESTIKRVIKKLEQAKFLRRERRYFGYGKRSNDRYVLSVGQAIEVTVQPLEVKLTPNENEDKTPDQTLGAKLTPNEENAAPLEVNCDPYIRTHIEKIDKSIFIEEEPPAGVALPPDETNPVSEIDSRLGKIHPALSVTAIAARLKVADIADIDVLRATQTLLGRATRTVHNPVAFVATGIDRSPEVWRRTLPGFEPGQDVSGTISAREQRMGRQRAQAAACKSGEHDWGPTVWAEVDRAYCLPCGISRRSVDPVFRELQDEHDRYSNGGGESDGASA